MKPSEPATSAAPPLRPGARPAVVWRDPLLWITVALLTGQAVTGLWMSSVALGVPRLTPFEIHVWLARFLVPVLAVFLKRHLDGIGPRRVFAYLFGFWFMFFVSRFLGINTLILLGPLTIWIFWRMIRVLRPWLRGMDPGSAGIALLVFVLMQIALTTGLGTHLEVMILNRPLIRHQGIYALNFYALHQWAGTLLPIAIVIHLGLRRIRAAVPGMWRVLRRLRPRYVVPVLVMTALAFVFLNWNRQEWGDSHPQDFVPVRWSPIESAHYCGRCHTDEYRQWQVSMHRHAALNDLYRAAVRVTIERHGEKAADFCHSCHDPARELRRQAALETGTAPPTDDEAEGVTCISCHRVVAVDEHPKNANFRLGMLPSQFSPDTDPEVMRRVFQRSVEADSRAHRQHMNPLGPRAFLCMSCHRVDLGIPGSAAAPGTFVEDISSTWEAGTYGDREENSCMLCHMPRVKFFDWEKEDGRALNHPHHSSLGLQQSLALISRSTGVGAPLEERDRAATGLVHEFPGLGWYQKFAQISHGSLDPFFKPNARIQSLPFVIHATAEVSAERLLTVDLVTSNVRAGHALPAGADDIAELWLSVTLVTDDGRSFPLLGAVDETGRRDPRAPWLGSRWLDRNGQPITHHDLLSVATVADARRIRFGQTVNDRVQVAVPAEVEGKAHLALVWNYRRVSPDASLELLGELRPFPIKPIGEASIEIQVPSRPATVATPADSAPADSAPPPAAPG